MPDYSIFGLIVESSKIREDEVAHTITICRHFRATSCKKSCAHRDLCCLVKGKVGFSGRFRWRYGRERLQRFGQILGQEWLVGRQS